MRRRKGYLHIGEIHLFAGDRAKAEVHFQNCVSTGVTHFGEYQLAQAERERLRQSPSRR